MACGNNMEVKFQYFGQRFLECSHAHSSIVYCYFHAIMIQWSSCDEDHLAPKGLKYLLAVLYGQTCQPLD